MKKKILIVDDEIELCDIIAFQLQDEGYEVRQAYSFHIAVDVFREFMPEVVLSDMQMPGGTGLDLFHRLKEEGKEHKFYLVSGFLPLETEHLLKLGIESVIKKPMSIKDILNALQST